MGKFEKKYNVEKNAQTECGGETQVCSDKAGTDQDVQQAKIEHGTVYF